MYSCDITLRVRYAETDQMNVVYHGNYAQYFEVGRVESLRKIGISYKEIEASGILMPLVELHIRYLRPAHYDDLLTIRTTLKEMPTDHRIEFHQEVFNEDEKLLTIGRVVLYCIKAGSKDKTVMPHALFAKLSEFFIPE